MNIKKLFLFILTVCFSISSVMLCGFSFFKKKNLEKTTEIEQKTATQQLKETKNINNDVWCVTFQLVWNDFMDKFTNGKPVIFTEGNPPIADQLNKRLYTSDILSEDSYFKTQGKISNKLKKNIEQSIYKKFKEKSDILDLINWNAKDSYLFYVMLKKDFNFLTPFDLFENESFNNSNEKVKYFGIKPKSNKKLYKNLDVLFYKNYNEYAVKLLTKENEEAILYRTDNTDSFENLYLYVKNNTDSEKFTKGDILKVPFINIDKTISYDELCGKKIEGIDYIISQALQTIKFKMDNKGGTLKSEAAMAVMKTALNPTEKMPRYFLFDKRFILFLKEADKDKPYYAMTVENTDYLVKE